MPRRILTLVLVCFCLVSSSSGQQPDLYDLGTVRTLELGFSQPDWWTQLVNNYGTDTYIEATLTVDGTVYNGVGVRFRGFSSYAWGVFTNSQKRPFKIKMNAFNPGQKLLGRKTLNLSNSYRDPTFTREVLCYHVYRQFMPACGANWVKLVINGENWGVYINIEQMDKDFLDTWYRQDTGNRYEADDTVSGAIPDGSALKWFGSNPNSYMNNYDLKNENPANPPWDDLVDVMDRLNHDPLPGIADTLNPIFNIDGAMMYLALCNVLCNPDTYAGCGNNYWIVGDDHNGRMNVMSWGLNASIGTSPQAGLLPSARPYLDPFLNETNSDRPLLNRLLQVQEFRETYLAHMRTVLEEWLDWNKVHPMLLQWQSQIAAEVAADDKRLYPLSEFTNNLYSTYHWGSDEYHAGMQEIFDNRAPFLAGHAEVGLPAPEFGAVTHDPQFPTSADAVWVRAEVDGPSAPVGGVVLFHRVQGVFQQDPMFDDGQHNDGAAGDGVWGASLAAQPAATVVEYYVRAASATGSGGAFTFAPRAASSRPYSYQVQVPVTASAVAINEFSADNAALVADEAGEFDDWVEIINTTTAPFDLGGCHLTDDLAQPTKWQIPAGTMLQPGGVVLVWLDDDPSQGPLHATFKLSAGGESVGLFASDGTTLLDGFVFGPQATDITNGRLMDGGFPWVSLLEPTPGTFNVSGCGVRSYSALDSTVHQRSLGVQGVPSIGQWITLNVDNGDPAEICWIFASVAPQHFAMTAWGVDDILLITQETAANFLLSFDAAGQATVPVYVPFVPQFQGFRAYLQSFAINPASLAMEFSNAVELIICP